MNEEVKSSQEKSLSLIDELEAVKIPNVTLKDMCEWEEKDREGYKCQVPLNDSFLLCHQPSKAH